MVCPQCGTNNAEDVQFCIGCGLPADQMQAAEEAAPAVETPEEPVAPVEEIAPEETPVEQPPKKKSRKKWWFIGGGVLAVAAAAVAAFFLFFNKPQARQQVLYIKNNNLYCYDMTADSITELTDKLMDQEDGRFNSQILLYVQCNQDKTRVFYPEKVQYTTADYSQSFGFTLYYLDMNGKDAQPQKVDSGVSFYRISTDGSKVAYVKNGTLYRSDLESEEKIAKDISGYFLANDDLSRIGFVNTEGNVYLWQEGEEKEKIASNVSSIVHLAEDFSVLYYINDEHSLYKQEYGVEEKEKIASDVANAMYFASGELWYTVDVSKTESAMDYVLDDMAQQDAKLTEPELPEKPAYPEKPTPPLRSEYDSDEAFAVAKEQYELDVADWETETKRLDEEYQEAMTGYEAEKSAYIDKEARDAMREELAKKTVDSPMYELHYYDGKEDVLVTDQLAQSYMGNMAYETPVAVASIYDPEKVGKLNLSEIDYISDVDRFLTDARPGANNRVLLTGKLMSALQEQDADYTVSEDGKTVYYLIETETQDKKPSTTGDLYKISVKDGKAGKAELYDQDVYSGFLYLVDDHVYYHKDYDVESHLSGLYVDKTQVAEDVYAGTHAYYQGAFFYYTDYDTAKQHGTLHRYADGKSEQIDEEVREFTVTSEGEILYLYDFSQKYQYGTLYRYNGGDREMIDEEVQYLLPDSGLIWEAWDRYLLSSYGRGG